MILIKSRRAGYALPLSQAEQQQRVEAGRASGVARHRAETAPSVRQGSTGAPSRAAIALFRQGQARPDTRSRRGPWDTRPTELPARGMQASFRFHFPKAYRSATPDPPTPGAARLARVLRRGQRGIAQNLVVTNPNTMAEAQRHPAMREIVHKTIGVVREHQEGAIARGHEIRRGRALIPTGTHPQLVAQAYKHAALTAIHKAGLGDYDFKMDEALKAQLRPLVPFMRYAHRRVFDKLNVENKGKWDAFREEFGTEYRQRKFGKETGHVRRRMRPNHEFIKIDLGDLDDEALEKIDLQQRDQEQAENKNGYNAHSPVRLGQIALARATAAHKAGVGTHAASAVKHIPEPPGGMPPPAHAGLHIKDAAIAVERHFGLPRIGGARNVSKNEAPRGAADAPRHQASHDDGHYILGHQDLKKFNFGFGGSSVSSGMNLGNYDVDPTVQLRRAMRPRMRRHTLRVRMNTQRNLRRVLNGGITRRERWQLGASSRFPHDPFDMGKAAWSTLAKAKPFTESKHPRDKDGQFTGGQHTGKFAAAGASLGIAAGLGESLGAATVRSRHLLGRGSGWSAVGTGVSHSFLGAAGGAVGGVIVDAAIDKFRGRKHRNAPANLEWGDIARSAPFVAGMAAAGGIGLRAGGRNFIPVTQAAGRFIGSHIPGLKNVISASSQRTLREIKLAVRAAHKAGDRIVYRGAPLIDWAPSRRAYHAVYIAPKKHITRGYGVQRSFSGAGNVGSTTAYALKAGTKLLDASARADHSLPIYQKLVDPTLLGNRPTAGLPGFVLGRMAQHPLYALHVSPTAAQVKTLEAAGYHGTFGTNGNISLFDEKRLRPLYAQKRLSGMVRFPKKPKSASRTRLSAFSEEMMLGQPEPVAKRSPIDAHAAVAATPTPAQAKAGNYRMGHTTVGGLRVSIETPKGRLRSGVGPTGRKWSVRMPAHYGYLKSTTGADGDAVDVYLGPHAHEAHKHPVFVVDQHHADTKKFDETKSMLGFKDLDHATSTYDAAFSDKRGPERRGKVHTVDHTAFTHWVKNGDTTKPFTHPLKKGIFGRVAGKAAFGAGRVGGMAARGALRSGIAYAGLIGRSAVAGAKGGRLIGRKLGGEKWAERGDLVGSALGAGAVATLPYAAIGGGYKAVRMVRSHRRRQKQMTKGIIGDALAYGARRAAIIGPKLAAGARGLQASATSSMEQAGKTIAGSRLGQAVGRGAEAIAAHPRVAPILAHPRVAAGIARAREIGMKGVLEPVQSTGEIAGAAIGGERGAKIGGKIASGVQMTVDHAPKALAIGGAALAGLGIGHATAGIGHKKAPSAQISPGTAKVPSIKAPTLGKAKPRPRAGSIYMVGLKNTLRDHMRVLDGGTPSPHQLAVVARAHRTNKEAARRHIPAALAAIAGAARGNGAMQA